MRGELIIVDARDVPMPCNTRFATWFAEMGLTDFGLVPCRLTWPRLDLSMACACVLLRPLVHHAKHQKRAAVRPLVARQHVEC